MESIHFCGGLPRCGSTVLMNILQQNPRVFTTSSCAFADILSDSILLNSRSTTSLLAMSVKQSDEAMYGLVHGAVKGWFEALTNKPTIISKRPGWSNLFHLFPKSKFICLTRDLRDIVESFEKINKNLSVLHSFSDYGAYVPSMSLDEKYNYYFHSPQIGMHSMMHGDVRRMLDIHRQGNSNVMFIRYEDFTKDPSRILNDLCVFLDILPISHDLSNISQSELFEHDNVYFKQRSIHTTLSQFKYYTQPKRSLPDRFHQRVVEENRWYYEELYPEVLN